MADNPVQPAAVDEFIFPKHLFQDVAFIAGMDKGCSLVKILYQLKPTPQDNEEEVKLVCETYLNKDFHGAIDNFVKRTNLPQQPECLTLYVTGAGCEREIDVLREKTGMKVQFVDEFFSQAKGTHWLVQHAPADQLFYPDALTVDNLLEVAPKMDFYFAFEEKLKQVMQAEREKYLLKLPCFMAFMGSATGFLEVQESGDTKFTGLLLFGGKTFLSLARLLLRTGDYNEIMKLAESGDHCKVDTQVGEMFVTSSDSAVGDCNPNDALFHFGKAYDQNRNLNTFQREDVAASLVRFCAMTTASSIYHAAKSTGFHRIYVGGNLGRSILFRKALMEQISIEMFTSLWPMEVRFMKTGHTAAFGSMLTRPGAANKIH